MFDAGNSTIDRDWGCPFHEKAGFVKAAVAARHSAICSAKPFRLASIRTLLSRRWLGAC
jgi:hypothetical protein